MKEVGIRELKNRLSEYLRLVREGEVVMVTDRGEVIAELRPSTGGAGAMDWSPGLAEAVSRGWLRFGGPNRPELYPPFAPLADPGTAARLLDEERGER